MNLTLISVVLIVVACGAVLAFQAPSNAALARGLGDPVLGAAISFGFGFLLLGAVALWRGPVIGLAQLGAIPWWGLIGGALGALWVLTALWSVPRLGVVTMISAMVLGQMIAAAFIDYAGVMGLEPRPMSLQRVMAISLVGMGVILSAR